MVILFTFPSGASSRPSAVRPLHLSAPLLVFQTKIPRHSNFSEHFAVHCRSDACVSAGGGQWELEQRKEKVKHDMHSMTTPTGKTVAIATFPQTAKPMHLHSHEHPAGFIVSKA